jgi:hypothetical protein
MPRQNERRAVRMWATYSPGPVGTDRKALLICQKKKPTYLANCYRPVAVVSLRPEDLEKLSVRLAKVLGVMDYMDEADAAQYRIAAKAVLREIFGKA